MDICLLIASPQPLDDDVSLAGSVKHSNVLQQRLQLGLRCMLI